jgi:hypothetical protein
MYKTLIYNTRNKQVGVSKSQCSTMIEAIRLEHKILEALIKKYPIHTARILSELEDEE